jgi:hypothetical protein
MSHQKNVPCSTSRSFIGVSLVLLVLASAAMTGCSLFAPQGPQFVLEPGEPSATPTSTNTPVPEWPPTWTPTPTFTPWPTVTPTFTPTSTPTAADPTPAPGYRRPRRRAAGAAGGPLKIGYNLDGVYCSGSGYIANFTIWAEGGDGQYTYYRDIDKIGGPIGDAVTYQLEWAECGGAPGTFTVKSGDDQEVSVKFWVHRPSCCG